MADSVKPAIRGFTIVVIVVGLLLGALISTLSVFTPPGSAGEALLLTIGSGIIATALISLILDLFWSRERARAEQEQLQPFLARFEGFTHQLEKLEGRLEAFRQLGLNYCHSSRTHALKRFLTYANDLVTATPEDVRRNGRPAAPYIINIVSSSARGLMGYLDREPHEVQREWRDLMTQSPRNFRILLTHPAYAHLRQPAEERSSGDIELEILKTAIYLHCVAGMGAEELRFYRGSPTVFAIQAGKHILLNPYPYGKMAMDTLCLEFESENEGSFVAGFTNMHFNHTWAFINQPSKLVDGRSLVEGVGGLEDILAAFAECTYLGEPLRLRLTRAQVHELDTFIGSTLKGEGHRFIHEVPVDAPFTLFVTTRGLKLSDDPWTEPTPRALEAGDPRARQLAGVAVAGVGTGNAGAP